MSDYIETIRHSTPIARKEYYNDAYEWVVNYGDDLSMLTPKPTFAEMRLFVEVIRLRMHKKIVKGQKYIKQVNKYEGDIYTYRASIELHKLCCKIEIAKYNYGLESFGTDKQKKDDKLKYDAGILCMTQLSEWLASNPTYTIDEIKGRKIAVKCHGCDAISKIGVVLSGTDGFGELFNEFETIYILMDNYTWSTDGEKAYLQDGYTIIDSQLVK